MATKNFLDKTGLGLVWEKIKALIPTKTSELTNDSGYLTSYTETDPVFSSSAAAGIKSTDISNWNAKVSDDKTWNGVTLNKSGGSITGDVIIPALTSSDSTSAMYITGSSTAGQYKLAKYDASAYLYSTTPSADDNSKKVATTAFVNSAISGITDTNTTYSISMSSNRITLTPSSGTATYVDLPVYDGGVSA